MTTKRRCNHDPSLLALVAAGSSLRDRAQDYGVACTLRGGPSIDSCIDPLEEAARRFARAEDAHNRVLRKCGCVTFATRRPTRRTP